MQIINHPVLIRFAHQSARSICHRQIRTLKGGDKNYTLYSLALTFKSSIVFCKPSSSETIGNQSSCSLAKEMSGISCLAEYGKGGSNLISEFELVKAITNLATSTKRTSWVEPMLTGVLMSLLISLISASKASSI